MMSDALPARLTERQPRSAAGNHRAGLLRSYAVSEILRGTRYTPTIWVDCHASLIENSRHFGSLDGVILIEDPGHPVDLSIGARSVLRLAFHDTFPGYEEDDAGRRYGSMSADHAQSIIAWYRAFAQDRGIIHVSCTAGVSRSRAIAAALLRLRGDDDLIHFENGLPNGHVYVTMLGLPPLRDYVTQLDDAYRAEPRAAITF